MIQQSYPDIGPSQSDIPEMQGVPGLPSVGSPMAAQISGVPGMARQLPAPGQGAPDQPPLGAPGQPGGPQQPSSPPTPPSRSGVDPGAAQSGYNAPPPSPPGAPPVLAPRDRTAKVQLFSDLLAKFTYSIASAYSAPPNRRLGAALMGGFNYDVQKRKEDLDRSQEQLRTGAYQKAMNDISASQTMLPARVEQLVTEGLRNRGLAKESDAKVPEIGARTDNINADTDLKKAEADKAKMFVTTNGVFRMNSQTQQMEQVPGADTVTRIEITPSMAKDLRLPDEVVGMKLRPRDINDIVGSFRPHTKIFKDADGVQLYDEDTQKTTKLGDLPPVTSPGTWQPLLDSYGQIIQFFNPQTGHSVPVPIAGARRTGEAQATLTRADTMSQLDDMSSALRELASNHQGVIGPVAGTITGIARKFMDMDPEINAMFRLSDNMSDVLLRARSGAQINEQEYNRLHNLVPDPRSPKSKFFTDLEEFQKEVVKSRSFLPPITEVKTPDKPDTKPPATVTPAKSTASDQINAKFGKKKEVTK